MIKNTDSNTYNTNNNSETQNDEDDSIFKETVSYKDLVLYRVEVWWKRPPTDSIHSKRICTQPLTLQKLQTRKGWFCCPYWRRKFSNKFNTRLLVSELLGIPMATLYWYGKNPTMIPFHKLPPYYVIRPTSGSGSQGVFVMARGRNLKSNRVVNTREIVFLLQKYQMKHPYTDFLVEEFIKNEKGLYSVPVDYKIHMFGSRVAIIQRVTESDHHRGRHKLYSEDWTPLSTSPERILECYPEDIIRVPPKDLSTMISYAKKIGRIYDHYVRLDFFQSDRGPIFCEFTPTPCLGLHVTETGNRFLMDHWQSMTPNEYQPDFLK